MFEVCVVHCQLFWLRTTIALPASWSDLLFLDSSQQSAISSLLSPSGTAWHASHQQCSWFAIRIWQVCKTINILKLKNMTIKTCIICSNILILHSICHVFCFPFWNNLYFTVCKLQAMNWSCKTWLPHLNIWPSPAENYCLPVFSRASMSILLEKCYWTFEWSCWDKYWVMVARRNESEQKIINQRHRISWACLDSWIKTKHDCAIMTLHWKVKVIKGKRRNSGKEIGPGEKAEKSNYMIYKFLTSLQTDYLILIGIFV